MRIAIIGGGGFLGQKLARALAARGTLRDRPIEHLSLVDALRPAVVDAPFAVSSEVADIVDRAAVDRVLADRPDVIFHLAAIVSGQAEAEFDTGMAVNLFGSINVLEAARALGTAPVVVFTSSVAVYGGEAPSPILDTTLLNPQTSYGAQKAAVEFLVTDYSRKGFVDGRALRVATVSIRPGRPNAAASSFMSSIFREPLQGEEAVCPVDPDYPVWYCSPRRTIENFVRAAEVPAEALGQNRAFALPGRADTIGEMIAAMTRVAGEGPARLIRFEPDDRLRAIVLGWRADIRPEKALRLGMRADDGFEDNVRFFLEDDVRR